MSRLPKILYEVAELRRRYNRVHEATFGFSPRRLFRVVGRAPGYVPGDGANELHRIRSRLDRARRDLEELGEDDLSIRRGREIRTALAAYAGALAASSSRLEDLCACQTAPQSPEGAQLSALKVAYDDAVQYHKRLGARLTDLISTL